MTYQVKLGSIASGIVGFFTGPYGKIGMYALIIGGVLYSARLWLNAHDDRVAKAATITTSLAIKSDLDREYQIRLDANKQLVRQALSDKAKAEERYTQIVKMFDQAFERLRDIRAAIDERQVIYVERAAAVPPAELDATIRAVSNDIANRPANRSGEGSSPGPVVPASGPPQ